MIKKTAYGYTMEGKDQFLDIVFFADNIVRFVYSSEEKLPGSTPAIVGKPREIEVELGSNVIKTNSLKIVIDEGTLRVSIYDLMGNLLSRDARTNIDGREIEKELLWEKGFYGLGEKYGWINRMKTSTSNWNTDILGVAPLHSAINKEYHTAIPFYIGLDKDMSYGIYFDNSYRTSFDFCRTKENTVLFKTDGGNIDYYFIYGKKISEVIEGYSLLTGTMDLPRKEFLGYQQCRWSYENREELMYIAKKMREEKIPCDILYLDIDYMKDYKVFTIDTEKFYEFKEMTRRLKEMGFKIVVIIDPGIKVEDGYEVYKEGLKKDYFVKNSLGEVYIGEVWPGPAVFPDFLRKEVREWWGRLHRDLIDKGVEGIWNDMNEPSDFTTKSKTIPEDTIHTNDKGEIKSHTEIHNLYGMLEAEATYNGLLEIEPNKRPFILTRAAFSGTQRYSALWTGDNTSIWEHLEASIPMFLNLGLSGYSFIGADVGGFLEDSYGELLTRWTQIGAFTPLFRNHSAKGTIHQEPWSFDEDTKKVTKKYIELRYKFITYLYSLMRESSINGNPVIRPLFYHYQEDEKTYNINDQFLFGQNIMICPILRPGITTRVVYLPEGIWYDYWTDEKIEGNKHIVVEAPLDILPIFIKAGSIVPQDEVMNFVDEKKEILELHYYSGNDGEYEIYLDDGASFDYKNGVYSEVLIKCKEIDKTISISVDVKKDSYHIPKLKVHFHGAEEDNMIEINGERYDKSSLIIDIRRT